MIENPDICECGSQLFTAVWSVTHQDGDDEQIDPKAGNTLKRRVGFVCAECGAVQLTREIPKRHADDAKLSYPEAADRDMVRE